MLRSLIACVKRLLGSGPKPANPNPGATPSLGASVPKLGTADTPPAGTQPTPFPVPVYIAPTGLYPSPGTGEPHFTLAMIHMAVGTAGQSPFDALPADGRLLTVSQGSQADDALYSVLLNQFGGEPPSFSLPDLRARAPIGVSQGTTPPKHTVPMMWIMATKTVPLFNGAAGIAAGMVVPFAGSAAPYGWVSCDGTLFTQAQYPELYALFGNAFGWLPGGQVSLPRLPGSVVVGAGAPFAPGFPNTFVGTTIDGPPLQGMCLNYLICWNGVWPDAGTPNTPVPYAQGFVGQIIAYAGNEPPPGWLLCDGSLIAIETYQALFALILTSYGGDGETTFATPDLRGKMLIGPSA
jgi:microcystin-dependent protein